DTEWADEYPIPRALFETYVGPLGRIDGQTWRANFYKCGDETSHPHWASWAPIGEELNFHQPQYFAPIHFD
ncbi:MAG: diguanylate cyclase, partial [Candidatus Hydrogenedentes bacterium]|nr:diguanylate cyclase [Candidatus Hydrogenedentota bacterium]